MVKKWYLKRVYKLGDFMKKLVMLIIMLLFISCTSSTQYGTCIGAFDDKDPNKVYKVSAWNIAMGVIFFEMVLPPIFVIIDETLCPVGIKNDK